jgi:hypothetical protein
MSLLLPALITQLRAAYPTVSLMSELLAIESNVFVVRALIQIGSVTLATGLAAATDVETAEDRAKCRAIETLIPTAASSPSSVSGTAEPAVSPLPDRTTHFSPASAPVVAPLAPIASPPAEPLAVKPELLRTEAPGNTASPGSIEAPPQTTPQTTPQTNAAAEALTDWDNPMQASRSGSSLDLNFDLNDLDLNNLLQNSSTPTTSTPNPIPEEALPTAAADLFAAVTSDPAAPIDPPVNLSDLNLTKLKLPQDNPPEAELVDSPKPTRRKSAAPSAAPPEPAPIAPPEIDRSGEIARIGVEMKRLGWDTKKGRDHLQKTYGKRSRQELNDDELMDFLRYLETQPSSAQMPF